MSSIPQEVAVEATGLTKTYGQGDHTITAIDQINVAFKPATFTAIMGPSGSGKSTLMHCLAGLDKPDTGQIIINQTNITSLKDKELTHLRRDKIGFIFQAFNLLPTLTAEQNILLPLDLAGKKPDNNLLNTITASLNIQNRLTHRPSQLSGGQQQRVAIARALITQPDVVFADEPTGALDTKTGNQLLDYLQKCTTQLGQTIIMVTHDPRAASYADRALILVDGQIQQDIPNPTQEAISNTMTELA